VIMQAQVLEGVADLLASGLLLVGVKRAKLPFDKQHPYGYGQELYLWTFLSALATFFLSAVASFLLGLKRFYFPLEVDHLVLSIIVLAITVVTNGYAMSLSLKRLKNKNGLGKNCRAFFHPKMIETKTTFISDLMGTSSSVLGLLALLIYQLTGNFQFDSLGAMTIGVVLAVLAFLLLKIAKNLLVGQSASPETEKKIKKIVHSFNQVKKIIKLKTLQLGPNNLLISLDLHLDEELKTEEIETVINQIETKIKETIPQAGDVQIEPESLKNN
ncbi:cation diffusion facilitator family transporter, partial [Patescibacteria group bacterium]